MIIMCREYLKIVLFVICLHDVASRQPALYDVPVKSLLKMQQGIGWPLQLNVTEGHEALMRLSITLENQLSCKVTTPAGLTFDVLKPPNDRFKSWSDGCGVRVKKVVSSDTGRWRLTASESKNHTLTGWTDVQVLGTVPDIPLDAISLQDGQTKAEVTLSNLKNSYCLVAQPFSESSLVPGHCSVILDRTTRAVQGRWNVLLGVPGRVSEVHVERNVVVEAERLDVGFVRDDNTHKLHLYCNILHSPKNVSFCRFQKSSEASGFNVVDGLSNGRYSYYGDGFSQKHCGMTIESVLPADYGTWRCTVGVQEWEGTVIKQITPMQALISVPTTKGKRIMRQVERNEPELKTLFVQKDSSLTMKCRAEASLAYCWFQHPNGSQFTPVVRADKEEQDFWYTGENLQTGDCGITFRHVSEEDAGMWTCHMGYLYQLGIEVTDTLSVRVTGPLAAHTQEIDVVIGGEVTIYCLTSNGPRPLDYCRFLTPKFVGISVDSTVTAENAILDRYYFTPERKLQYGDCSLTINPVHKDDIGKWTCAALVHDEIVESRDTIIVSAVRSARSYRVRAGLGGTAGAIAVLALVLAGFMWYKKAKTSSWPSFRFSNRSEVSAVQPRMQRSDSRISTSTTSSNEQDNRQNSANC